MPFPFRLGRQLSLHDDAIDFDTAAALEGDISITSSLSNLNTLDPDKTKHDSSSSSVFVFVGQVSCMDSKHSNTTSTPNDPTDDRSRRLRPAQSAVTLSASPSPRRHPKQEPLSSPLPQGHWSQIPAAYRPQSFINTGAPLLESSSAFRERLPPPQISAQTASNPLPSSTSAPKLVKQEASPSSGRRRAPPASIVVREPTALDQPNQPFLYPQLSPYDDPVRTQRAYDSGRLSAPMHPQRSVSQPQSPTWHGSCVSPLSPTATEGLPSLGLPRAPTYPPVTTPSSAIQRRRTMQAGIDAAALQDEQELAMFAAASVGLGPEGTFRPAHASIDTSNQPFYTTPGRGGNGARNPVRSDTQTSSATADTPTTRMALMQLAQMPSSSAPSSRRPLGRANTSALDTWNVPSPAATTTAQSDVSPIDEEPPDYATSQAQAVAKSRQAAALRAQELQRRWRAGMGSSHDRM